MYNSSKNWIRTGVLAMGLAVPFVAANAQGPAFQQPVGTVGSCNAVGSTIVQTAVGQTTVPFAGGVGTFETISNSPVADPVASTTLRAVSVVAAGRDPQLGEVVWEADIPRTDAEGLVTTIKSDQPGEAFPATGTFQFYGRITLSSEPGVVYLSRTPVTLTGTVTAWPHNQTPYRSTGTVVYERADNPQITITTPVMNPTMTAQNPPPPPPPPPFQQPIGTVSSCSATGSTLVQTAAAQVDVPFNGGIGTFETVSNSQPGTPASTSLRALSVVAAGNDPQLGKVVWEADIERTNREGLLTTVTSDGLDAFPATGTFQFYGRITLESEPGVVYLSRTPVTLTGSVRAWPHNQTAYTSAGPVVYERADNPNITITTPVMNPTMTAVPAD